jgi:(1->4)-alpha-D-glucan 1-alpha-D-glucosylmutase
LPGSRPPDARTDSPRNCSSWRDPACPTSTRAANSGSGRSSTPTTGGPSTSRRDAGELPEVDETGAAKLLVTSRTLRARRDRPELFDRYLPLPAVGPAADHVVAADRGGAIVVATRLPFGLDARGGWADTALLVPAGRYVDAFTSTAFDAADNEGAGIPLAALLARYPVALLLPEAA